MAKTKNLQNQSINHNQQHLMDYNAHPLCQNATIYRYYNVTFLMHPSKDNIDHFIRYETSLTLFSLSIIHIIISLSLFIILRSSDQAPRIRIRSVLLVLITAIAVLIHSVIGFFPFFFYPIPSWLLMPLVFLLLALSIVPIPLRLFGFYGRYVFSLAVAQLNIYEAADTEITLRSREELEKYSNHNNNNNNNNFNAVINEEVDDEDTKSNVSKTERPSVLDKVYLGERSPSKLSSSSINKMSFISNSPRHSMDASNAYSLNMTPYSGNPSAAAAAEAVAIVNHSHCKDKERNRIITDREMLFLRFVSSPLAQLTALVLALIPLVFVAMENYILIPALDPAANCYGVELLDSTLIIHTIYALLALIIGLICAFKIRKFADPFGIVKETRLFIQYGGVVALVSFLLDSLVTTIPDSLSFDYFLSIGVNLMLFTVTEYQVYLAVREKYGLFSFSNLWDIIKLSLSLKRKPRGRKLNAVSSTPSTDSTRNDQILKKDETLAREFMEMWKNARELDRFEKFLIGEFAVENLRMYIECRKWESMYYDATDSQRRARARKIVSYFVDVGSLFEVNIPDGIRNEIKVAVENKNVPLTLYLFSKSQDEMLGIMYDAFQRYKTTNPLDR